MPGVKCQGAQTLTQADIHCALAIPIRVYTGKYITGSLNINRRGLYGKEKSSVRLPGTSCPLFTAIEQFADRYMYT